MIPPPLAPPTAPFVPARLPSPSEAIAAFLERAALPTPLVEEVDLDSAFDRVLAIGAVAREDHPSHPRSTMDGFAVAADAGRDPRKIVGEVLMGAPPPRSIERDEAMRIPTGGALPDGADAVVPLEEVIETDGVITLVGAPPAGDCVTPRGSDVRSGEVVVPAGRRIGGPELGVLATIGYAHVPVFRRPVFGIISTGDELIDPDRIPGIGQVRDSNRYAIGGALRASGITPHQLPRVADTAEALRSAIADALAAHDGIILTGGSSVGFRDLVPRIVADLGPPGIIIHGIRLKPGKPTMLASIGGKPVIGLPGNPTSALMVLEAVGRLILAASTGERASLAPTIEAVAGEEFVGREGWTWFVPTRVEQIDGRLIAYPLRLHSAHTSLLARASGYVVLGESTHRIALDEPASVVRFSCGGILP